MKNFCKIPAWTAAVPAERSSDSAPAPSEAYGSTPRDAPWVPIPFRSMIPTSHRRLHFNINPIKIISR